MIPERTILTRTARLLLGFVTSAVHRLATQAGLEAIVALPDGTFLMSEEGHVTKDGVADQAITTTARGGDGRLIAFEPSGSGWKPGQQWRYRISPTPLVDGYPTLCSDGENGLVELLAITETTLLAMERACWLNAAGEAANPIQLFAVTLSGNTARKTLLLDLSTLALKLSPALAQLENFEGLAFGPPVDGTRTLLLMSDDNFRPRQKTSFLLFGLR